jgi:parallel beta-helix repeat protein
MNYNLTSTGTCFTIVANSITIDGAGFNITGDDTENGIYAYNFNFTTIQNFYIYNFSHGIHLEQGKNNTIFNNRVSFTDEGIFLDDGFVLGSSQYNNVSSNIITDTTPYPGGYGIHFASYDLIIDHNQIYNNSFIGIEATSSPRVIITNNIFDDNYNNINQYSDNGNISFNQITDGLNGIYMLGADNNVIQNNTIQLTSSAGISFFNANGNDIIDNRIDNNPIGINIASSVNSLIFNNSFDLNKKSAVFLSGSSNSNITNNTITNTSISCTYDGTQHCNVSFSGDESGISLCSGSNNNRIENLNFYGNTTQNQTDDMCGTDAGINIDSSTNTILKTINLHYPDTYGIKIIALSDNTSITSYNLYGNNSNGALTNDGVIQSANTENLNITNAYFENTSEWGLFIDSSINAYIQNVTVNNAQYMGIRMSTNSTNAVIRDCYVTRSGHGGGLSNAIHLEYADNATIINNYVTANTLVGIYADVMTDSNISNNNITSNAEDGINIGTVTGSYITNNTILSSTNLNGIYFVAVNTTEISNNNISSNNADGIYILSYGYNNIIEDNIINENGNDGIESITSTIFSSNNLTNNTISSNTGDGIDIDTGASDNFISNSINSNGGKSMNIADGSSLVIYSNTAGSNADGISINAGNNNNLTNNTISSNTNDGIFLSNGNSHTIDDNIIIGGSNGLHLSGSDSNNITNNNINSVSGNGILLSTSADDNTISDNVVNSSQINIYFIGTNNNVVDSDISGGTTNDILSNSNTANNTILNCTFDKSNTNISDGVVYVKWYMDVYVNNTNGSAVNNSDVEIYDVDNILQFNLTTNSSGYVARQNVTEYLENLTNKFYDSPIRITATATGYNTVQTINSFTTNKITDYSTEIFLTLNSTAQNQSGGGGGGGGGAGGFNSTWLCIHLYPFYNAHLEHGLLNYNDFDIDQLSINIINIKGAGFVNRNTLLYYVNNYQRLCNTSIQNIPNQTQKQQPIKKICSLDIPIPFKWSIPFFRMDLGIISCDEIDFWKTFFQLEQPYDVVYIVGIRMWAIFTLVLIIVIVWYAFKKRRKN